MNEPIKPNYTENEITEMNLKLEEQEKELNDYKTRKKYIKDNLSSKSKAIILFEGAMNGLYHALYVVAFILATYWMLFIVLDIEKYETITDICLMIVAAGVGGYFVSMFAAIFTLVPISVIAEALFRPIHRKLEEEEKELNDKYQSNIIEKYRKYKNMKKNLDNYNIKLFEYKDYKKKQYESFWYSLDGHTFEQEVAKIFRKDGYHAHVSKVGADGGVDIILTKNGKRYAVQCKAHNKKISEGVARDLYGVLHANNYDGGYLVTLNGVSAKTYKFCKTRRDKPIIIWTIRNILKKYSE